MATHPDTTQFTARISAPMMRTIKRLAERQGVSNNEKLNELLQLGLIALAAKKKRASAETPAPTLP